MNGNMDDKDNADEYTEYQRDLAEHVQEVPMDDEGFTLVDPRTGEKYLRCDSCGDICTLEDYHSGGECNFCHAVNKDD